MTSILVVDDERSMRDFLKILLIKEGYQVETVSGGLQALEVIEEHTFNLVITDIRMDGMDGLELLSSIKEKHPALPVVMITAFASPDDAVFAMKNGAFDYVSKPFNVDEITSVISSATSKGVQSAEAKSISAEFPEIIGESREMVKIFEMIQRIAITPANVLIYGESGTGKELVAQAIHRHSLVADQNFIPITCSAIPEELMESELFGHTKGSFTGAISDKQGLFQLADNGTAFLDEIGELTPIIQTKLLRVLQEREVKPVGGVQVQNVNVRIIAATNRILEEEIMAGRFREDLFYRLAVVPLRVPPLRERKGDVPLLVAYFLNKYSKLFGKEVQEMSSYAMEVLMKYDFPGNVRELENIIERGVALESSNIILPESLTLSSFRTGQIDKTAQPVSPFQVVANEEELFDMGLEELMAETEKRCLIAALEKTGNSKMRAAELLQVSFRSLRYKVKKYGIG
ncbi:MAG TPA: sigma-54-dependent Fis family transcriptional regulator [Desulfocapsa sulfexigens]|nr:sigma-54-dependent Fis family transcriptional regulator [Desulfocapsa sulfexigens]